MVLCRRGSVVRTLGWGWFGKLWLAGHCIPAVFPSLESQTTWPVLLHSGHSARSPTATMPFYPPFSCCQWRSSFQISFSSCKWFWRMTCIVYSFLLNLPLMNTILFTSWLYFWEDFNYSIGLAQRIRETLHLNNRFQVNKRMLVLQYFQLEKRGIRGKTGSIHEGVRIWTRKTPFCPSPR